METSGIFEQEQLSLWTFSAEDGLARTSASPARAPVSVASAADYGPNSRESLASYDPATASWKTSQLCLDGEWAELLETWPRSGMTVSGTLYPLPPLVRLISESESGSLLPTPTATEYGSTNNGKRGDGTNYRTAGTPSLWKMAKQGLLPTPTEGDAKASGSRNTPVSKAHPGVSLTDWARGDHGQGRLLPTPTARLGDASYRTVPSAVTGAKRYAQGKRNLEDAVAMMLPTPTSSDGGAWIPPHGTGANLKAALLPTPQASDWKNCVDYHNRSRGHSPQLRHLGRGRLNPRFVEWMMGFPPGWTELDSLPSAMRSSRK